MLCWESMAFSSVLLVFGLKLPSLQCIFNGQFLKFVEFRVMQDDSRKRWIYEMKTRKR